MRPLPPAGGRPPAPPGNGCFKTGTGAGWDPGPITGPTHPRLLPDAVPASSAQVVCAPAAAVCRRRCCALRVRHPPAAALPCVLRPLRRGAPAAASRARSGVCAPRCARPGPPRAPPAAASSLGLCLRACALGGLSLAPAAFGPGLAALRASCSVALAALGLGPCAARGSPLPLGAPLRASGAAGSGRGRCRLRRLLCRFAAPAFVVLACCARCACVGFCGLVLSPAPPRPAAPAGGSGERVAHSGWLRPPLRGSRFSRPSCGPPRGVRPPGLTVRKL